MWANLHLLFWLSLIPFATAWVGQNPHAAVPTAIYCAVLFCCGLAYTALQLSLIAVNGQDSTLARALGTDWKGRLSLICYAAAIALAFVALSLSELLVVAIAILWFVPDPRVEHALSDE